MGKKESIRDLQPLNIMLGWKATYNNLTKNEQKNRFINGTLLELEYKLNDQRLAVLSVKDGFQIDWTRLSNSTTIKSVIVQNQKTLVSELENMIFNIDYRTDTKTPYNYIPLRLPSGWKVLYNTCINIDPDTLNEKDDQWLNFTDELLFLGYDDGRILIDIGWEPEASPDGYYSLGLVIDDDWENLEKLLHIRRPEKLVEAIEDIMVEVEEGKYDKPPHNT
ncbi:hypothetical protein [Priestia filamentosa]|uniref:hypothetical protein n=1 Tax=Priestia filamentosa TaxID=1402861 RepID=UPI002E1FD76C|nr:hypothetical protein [Priestia filamentosa]